MSIGKPVAGVCVSTALFVCGAAGFPEASSELPPKTGTLVLNETSSSTNPIPIAAGGSFTLRGDGFSPNAAITVVVYSEPREVGHAVADVEGTIAAAVTLPDDLQGRHTVTAIGNGANGSPRSLQASVEVLAAGATTGPTSLAFTGLSVAGMLAGAAGLIVAGFALVRTAVYGRRLTVAR